MDEENSRVQVRKLMDDINPTHLTEREKSPGALSLSLMRKAPSCLCLFSISSALARGIFPKNHLEKGRREKVSGAFRVQLHQPTALVIYSSFLSGNVYLGCI